MGTRGGHSKRATTALLVGRALAGVTFVGHSGGDFAAAGAVGTFHFDVDGELAGHYPGSLHGWRQIIPATLLHTNINQRSVE